MINSHKENYKENYIENYIGCYDTLKEEKTKELYTCPSTCYTYKRHKALEKVLRITHLVTSVCSHRDGKYILISYWKNNKNYVKRSKIKII